MKGMVINVPEEAFRNLVSLNVEHFFNNLAEDEKKEISDLEKCGEFLKRTPEYQYLERAIRILTKCNTNLHNTILRERQELQNLLILLKDMKVKLDESNQSLGSMFNSCEILK